MQHLSDSEDSTSNSPAKEIDHLFTLCNQIFAKLNWSEDSIRSIAKRLHNLTYESLNILANAAAENDNQHGDNHSEKYAKIGEVFAICEEIYGTKDQEKIVFAALYELLTTVPGSHGPNSFKYALLSNIFLCDFKDSESKLITDCFIRLFEEIKNNERKKFAKLMAPAIHQMSIEGFMLAMDRASVLKHAMEIKSAGFVYFYSLLIRSFTIDDVSYDMDFEKIGTLDATNKIFNLAFALTGKHSFKFIFLLHLFGWEVKASVKQKEIRHGSMHACLKLSGFDEENDAELIEVAQFLYSVFAKGSEDEANLIINALIEQINLKQKELFDRRCLQIDGFIDACFKGHIATQTIIEAVKAEIRDRTAQDTEKFNDYNQAEKLLSNLANWKKNANRPIELDNLLKALADPKTNKLELLTNFLKDSAGGLGPHSLKYSLLKRLFPTLNDDIDITKAESSSSIKLFIERGKKKLEHAVNMVSLEDFRLTH